MLLRLNIKIQRLALTSLLLIAIGYAMPVQAQNASGSNSNHVASPVQISPIDLQKALAKAEYEQARADEAVRSRDEWKAQSGVWQSLFLDERKRSDLLTSAISDRKEAGSQNNIAIGLMQAQVKDDGERMTQLNSELRTCQRGKILWTIGGLGLGYGARAFSNK